MRTRLRVVPHFSSGIVEREKPRARVKITPREKRRHAVGREKNEGLQTKPKESIFLSRVEGRGFHGEGEGTMSRVEGNIVFSKFFLKR